MGRFMSAMKSIQIYIHKDAIANLFIELIRTASSVSKALGFSLTFAYKLKLLQQAIRIELITLKLRIMQLRVVAFWALLITQIIQIQNEQYVPEQTYRRIRLRRNMLLVSFHYSTISERYDIS